MGKLHQDFHEFKEKLCTQLSFEIKDIHIEKESREYSACSFKINQKSVLFRVAKTTPTKLGHFVTLWKRNSFGVTEPYQTTDNIDFFIIVGKESEHFGAFIFPKNILTEKNIVSTDQKLGKRGVRVYAPWFTCLNPQATKTQSWQTPFFIDLNKKIDEEIINVFKGNSV